MPVGSRAGVEMPPRRRQILPFHHVRLAGEQRRLLRRDDSGQHEP
jgi:hypothetical protein